MISFRLCIFARHNTKVMLVFLIIFYQVGHDFSVISYNIHFDHLIKVVSPGFSTAELLFFSFVISKHFVGSYFETM